MLVYLHADHDLEPASIDDLHEMAQSAGRLHDDMHIVLLYDRRLGEKSIKSGDILRPDGSWVSGAFGGTKLLRLNGNGTWTQVRP